MDRLVRLSDPALAYRLLPPRACRFAQLLYEVITGAPYREVPDSSP